MLFGLFFQRVGSKVSKKKKEIWGRKKNSQFCRKKLVKKSKIHYFVKKKRTNGM
eukprot:m.107498 g.107498  ORF g.107498 m.107498 type:complete len:54 (-) comp19050_c1_seq1:450-611(-)